MQPETSSSAAKTVKRRAPAASKTPMTKKTKKGNYQNSKKSHCINFIWFLASTQPQNYPDDDEKTTASGIQTLNGIFFIVNPTKKLHKKIPILEENLSCSSLNQEFGINYTEKYLCFYSWFLADPISSRTRNQKKVCFSTPLVEIRDIKTEPIEEQEVKILIF